MPFNPTALRNAGEQTGFDEAPPPASYEAELYKAETFYANTTGEQFLRLGWKILTGRLRDHKWQTIHCIEDYKPDGTDNEGALRVTMGVLKGMGVEITDAVRTPDDLLAVLHPLVGAPFAIDVKQSGQYRNTWPQNPLASVQQDMPVSGYGQPPQSQNAVYQGDGPAQSGGLLQQAAEPRYPEATGESDVPGAKPGEFEEPPPQKGDIDPATGEPIPF